MKKILLVLLMFGSLPLFADISSANIALTTNNLAATYSTSFPQLALSGLQSVNHLAIFNGSSTDVCCYVLDASPTSAPAINDGHEVCCPGNSNQMWNNIGIYSNVYCRSTSGTLSTGTLRVQVW